MAGLDDSVMLPLPQSGPLAVITADCNASEQAVLCHPVATEGVEFVLCSPAEKVAPPVARALTR